MPLSLGSCFPAVNNDEKNVKVSRYLMFLGATVPGLNTSEYINLDVFCALLTLLDKIAYVGV